MVWKNVLLIGSMTVLLSSCSQINSLLNKIPFTANDSGNSHQQKEETQINDPLSLESIFFNDIKEVDGKNVIQNSTNVMALVNKEFYLPDDYIPQDLVRPDVEFSFGDVDTEKSLMREEAATALENMFSTAQNSGIELYAVSGYRSYNRQQQLFNAEINRVGIEKAEQAVAIPGASEHQSGLAMDISSKYNRRNMAEGQRPSLWIYSKVSERENRYYQLYVRAMAFSLCWSEGCNDYVRA
jgi:zinc D-Ala-D-Ala carboxypeptidase